MTYDSTPSSSCGDIPAGLELFARIQASTPVVWSFSDAELGAIVADETRDMMTRRLARTLQSVTGDRDKLKRAVVALRLATDDFDERACGYCRYD